MIAGLDLGGDEVCPVVRFGEAAAVTAAVVVPLAAEDICACVGLITAVTDEMILLLNLVISSRTHSQRSRSFCVSSQPG